MISFIGFVLLVYCLFYGSYANPLWKLHENAGYYANGLFRALIGLPAWVAAIFLLMGKLGGFFLWLLVTAGCAALSLLKMYKDGILCVRSVHLLIMASMGAWGRVLLAWTGIGLIATSHTKRAAEIGWEGAALEWMENNARNAQSNSGPSAFDVLREEDRRRAAERAAQEAANAKPEVEVWREREDGSKQRLQVNSDGSMYKDPDTGDWEPIRR